MPVQCTRCGSGVGDSLAACPICGAPKEVPEAKEEPAAPAAPAVPAGVPGFAPPGVPQAPGLAAPPPMPLGGAPGAPQPLTGMPPPQPLGGAPGAPQPLGGMPAYTPQTPPMGMGGGEVRVSLTGEVIETPAVAAPRPMPGPGGHGGHPGAGGPPRTGGPIPPAAGAKGRYGLPREEEAAPSNSAGKTMAIVFVLLLVVGGAFGGWYWYNNRTNPKDQAKLVAQSLVKRDWKAAFQNIAWKDGTQITSKSEEEFVAGAEAGFNRSTAGAPPQLLDALSNMEISTGEPVFKEGKADVPTTSKMNIMGQTVTFSGTAHMVRRGGKWKLDLTTVEPTDQQGMSRVMQDLIGQPQGMPGGAGGGLGGGMGGPMGR